MKQFEKERQCNCVTTKEKLSPDPLWAIFCQKYCMETSELK